MAIRRSQLRTDLTQQNFANWIQWFAAPDFGAVTLDTAVPVPANGQIGKGDAAPIAFPFVGHWSDRGGAFRPSFYMKEPNGWVNVVFNGQTNTNNDMTKAGTLPAGWRPGGDVETAAIEDSVGQTVTKARITAAGDVFPNLGNIGSTQMNFVLRFYAEQ